MESNSSITILQKELNERFLNYSDIGKLSEDVIIDNDKQDVPNFQTINNQQIIKECDNEKVCL